MRKSQISSFHLWRGEWHSHLPSFAFSCLFSNVGSVGVSVYDKSMGRKHSCDWWHIFILVVISNRLNKDGSKTKPEKGTVQGWLGLFIRLFSVENIFYEHIRFFFHHKTSFNGKAFTLQNPFARPEIIKINNNLTLPVQSRISTTEVTFQCHIIDSTIFQTNSFDFLSEFA